jgi:hypothetical protein
MKIDKRSEVICESGNLGSRVRETTLFPSLNAIYYTGVIYQAIRVQSRRLSGCVDPELVLLYLDSQLFGRLIITPNSSNISD